MKRSEAIALAKSAAESLRGQISTTETRGVRKGAGGGDDVQVTKENLSISKYFKGVILKDWTGADDEHAAFKKALSTEDGTKGGVFVPTIMSGEVIELLKQKAVVQNIPGVRYIRDMQTLSMEFNRVDAGPTISWGGENTTISEDTTLAFGKATLELKKAVCLYKMSRELLDNASPGVDMILRQELADQMALEEDKVVLDGVGGTQPLGIYWNPRVLRTDLSGVVTTDNLKTAVYNSVLNHVQPTAWVGHPRTRQTLAKEKDSQGRYIYAPNNGALVNGSWLVEGLPFYETTQVPITLRNGSNESFVVAADWKQLILGSKAGMRIETTDTGGDAFVTDQVWLKLVRHFGSLLRHTAAFNVVEGIQA